MLFDDKAWLNDYAEYGPSARAALGVLVAKGDWGWWNGRKYPVLRQALQSAIRQNGIAVWGGDEAVFKAHDWVDTAIAIDLARAFSDLTAEYYLRLRIERTVWNWPSVRNDTSELRNYLASAVPNRRVFFDWPQDRRPRTRIPDRHNGALVISSPSGDEGIEAGQAFVDALNRNSPVPVSDWRPGEALADVVLTRSIQTLTRGSISAELVIIATNDQRALVRSLDDVRRSTGAKCVVCVQESGNERWLKAFARIWAGNYYSIDTAAALANEEVGLEGEVLVSNQTFLLSSHEFPRPRAVDRAIEFRQTPDLLPRIGVIDFLGAKEVTPLSTTPPPTARVLEIDAMDALGKKLVELPSLGMFQIVVAVRPQTPLTSSLARFPDERVAWDADKRVVQIHLVELGNKPVTKELVLPRTGASDPISFEYMIASPEPIDLRFMVCDGAQILQTARFQGRPGEKFRAKIEIDITPLEDKPRSFEMALLVNDTLGGKPSITVIADDRVTINLVEGHEIHRLRDEARKTLSVIAANADLPFDEALKELADVGSRTLKVLRKWVENWPESFDRVQLMTKVNAIFPFEFLYDGDLPYDTSAPICPQSKTCLEAPRGTMACCPRRATGDVFCPMGFIGLNAVIERHAWDGDYRNPIWLRRSEDFSKRDALKSLTEIVFAASDNADDFDDDLTLPLDQQLARIKDVETAFGIGTKVERWEDWRNVVASESRPPSIAVLIPHVEGNKLFIGKSESQFLSNLSMGKASVAIVIGCNTAEGEVAALSLPNKIINDGRVKVVVAALTEVLGRHSNTAAMLLGTRIRAASCSSDMTTVGDFITELRRKFLARGIALGLVLVSIGDADVALGGN